LIQLNNGINLVKILKSLAKPGFFFLRKTTTQSGSLYVKI